VKLEKSITEKCEKMQAVKAAFHVDTDGTFAKLKRSNVVGRLQRVERSPLQWSLSVQSHYCKDGTDSAHFVSVSVGHKTVVNCSIDFIV